MAMSTNGRLLNASAHEEVGSTPNTVSFMKSVKSSWATWIHHSWGSLMKIQMTAAMPITARRLRRRGSQRSPHDLVGDEEVLERVGEHQQQPALGR